MGLLVEYIENGGSRVTTFKLICEAMLEKVILGLLFIILQSNIEN
jgi:hypothetical protein